MSLPMEDPIIWYTAARRAIAPLTEDEFQEIELRLRRFRLSAVHGATLVPERFTRPEEPHGVALVEGH